MHQHLIYRKWKALKQTNLCVWRLHMEIQDNASICFETFSFNLVETHGHNLLNKLSLISSQSC